MSCAGPAARARHAAPTELSAAERVISKAWLVTQRPGSAAVTRARQLRHQLTTMTSQDRTASLAARAELEMDQSERTAPVRIFSVSTGVQSKSVTSPLRLIQFCVIHQVIGRIKKKIERLIDVK